MAGTSWTTSGLPSSLQSAARYILGLPRDVLGERNPRPPTETDRAAGLKSLSGTVRKDAILDWTNLSPSRSRFFISSRNAPFVGSCVTIGASPKFVKPGRVRSFSPFFFFFHSRPVSGVGCSKAFRSVLGLLKVLHTANLTLPCPHKQNRGERFFRVRAGAAVHRLFFLL